MAELARVAEAAEGVAAEQGVVQGPVPLTPIQRWFLGRELPDPQHFNQSFLVEVDAGVAPGQVEQAAAALVAHHDALRLRLAGEAGGWRLHNAAGEPHPLITRIDLSGVPAAEQPAALEDVAAGVQASLDLAGGPLLRLACGSTGRRPAGWLLLVIHHLAVDGVSWRILLEDLNTAPGPAGPGEPVALAPKTTSFAHWART